MSYGSKCSFYPGTKWIDKLFNHYRTYDYHSGLGLAGSAVIDNGLVADGNWKNALASRYLRAVPPLSLQRKRFLRIIPFLLLPSNRYIFI